jgi:hypothetical protein
MKKVKNHFRTKIINVIDPKRGNELNNDIFFWKQRSSGERLNTVEFLREQIYLIQGHKSIPRFIYELKIVERPTKRSGDVLHLKKVKGIRGKRPNGT